MSFIVDVEKQCGCIKKSGWEFPKTFDSREKAEYEALELANQMNATFCKKHRFFVNKEDNKFTIMVEMACPNA